MSEIIEDLRHYASLRGAIPPAARELCNKAADEIEQLSESRLAAEVNRRRGEMAAARDYLDKLGIPKTADGVTLTFTQRIRALLSRLPEPPKGGESC